MEPQLKIVKVLYRSFRLSFRIVTPPQGHEQAEERK